MVEYPVEEINCEVEGVDELMARPPSGTERLARLIDTSHIKWNHQKLEGTRQRVCLPDVLFVRDQLLTVLPAARGGLFKIELKYTAT